MRWFRIGMCLCLAGGVGFLLTTVGTPAAAAAQNKKNPGGPAMKPPVNRPNTPPFGGGNANRPNGPGPNAVRPNGPNAVRPNGPNAVKPNGPGPNTVKPNAAKPNGPNAAKPNAVKPSGPGPSAVRPNGPNAAKPNGPNAVRPNGPNAVRPNGPGPNTVKPNGPGPNAVRPNGPNAVRPNGPNAAKPNGPNAVKPNGPGNGPNAVKPSGPGPSAVRPNGPNAVKPNGPNAAKPNGPGNAPNGVTVKPNGPNAVRPNGPNAVKPNGPNAAKPNAAKPNGPSAVKPNGPNRPNAVKPNGPNAVKPNAVRPNGSNANRPNRPLTPKQQELANKAKAEEKARQERLKNLDPNKKAQLDKAQAAAAKAREDARKNAPVGPAGMGTKPKPGKQTPTTPPPAGIKKDALGLTGPNAVATKQNLLDLLRKPGLGAAERKTFLNAARSGLTDKATEDLIEFRKDAMWLTPGQKTAFDKYLNGEPLSEQDKTILADIQNVPGLDNEQRTAITQMNRDIRDQEREAQAQQALVDALGNLGGGSGGGGVDPGMGVWPITPISGGAIIPAGPGLIAPAIPTVFIPSEPRVAPIAPGVLYPTVPGLALGVAPSPPPVVLAGGTTANELVVNLGAAAADATVWQNTRYIRLSNGTEETLTFHVQYEAIDEEGKSTWLPAQPGDEKVLTLELAPGEVVDLTDNDWRVNARKARIWCESKTRKYDQFKDQDLLLVPEVDGDGNNQYQADNIDVFYFTVK